MQNDDPLALRRLAGLVRERNGLDDALSGIIGRPALIGHVGEYIASAVFEIALHESATTKGHDGRFREGALSGATVNIKWFTKREGMLDVKTDFPPDYYLVLAGPRAPAGSSRGSTRPWVIASVHLFQHLSLVEHLAARRVKLGVATRVAERYWREAEVWPEAGSRLLALSPATEGNARPIQAGNLAARQETP